MNLNTEVKTVYDYIKANWQNTVRYETGDRGTLLGLPFPYTVPCQTEKTMQQYFYWDTYFTNAGLLKQGLLDLAKNNTDNLLFHLNKYGYVPNGNRTYFLDRSQPPYLSMIVREIFEVTRDKNWLNNAYELLKTEYEFWDKNRQTPIGLNRHLHHATDEELIKFYDDELKGRIDFFPKNREKKIYIANHYLTEAETGWDFTPRFEKHAADFAKVDLNSLLYQMEKNMVYFSKMLERDEEESWSNVAEKRRALFTKYFWNYEMGYFYDYNFVSGRQSPIASLAGFHPLWAKMATEAQAAAAVKNLKKFEYDFGVAVCENSGRKIIYQWDYPNGWPPLFYIVINGLNNYGFEEHARRIAEKYVRVVVRNFKSTGDLWEKYNVVDGSIRVNNEYEMPAMMGWTAGVFVFCAHFLYDF